MEALQLLDNQVCHKVERLMLLFASMLVCVNCENKTNIIIMDVSFHMQAKHVKVTRVQVLIEQSDGCHCLDGHISNLI